MDADCLIKLTKSGLKESVCRFEKVTIPRTVKREVVDAGKVKSYPDADIVDRNIKHGLITVARESSANHPSGDQALIAVFQQGGYEVIATDDARLIRILRSAGIPFTLPALLIYALRTKGRIDQKTALDWLDKLSTFVSSEEYAVTRLLLEERI